MQKIAKTRKSKNKPAVLKELNKIKKRIVETLHPEQIILFGSYAWGKPHRSSDLDLFIIVSNSPLSGHQRATEVYRALRTTERKIPLDVIVKTRKEVRVKQKVKTSLARKVLTQGKVIYGQSDIRRNQAVAG